jgi:putative N-acetylmannosamine-6-phosphate epimerase
VLPAHVHGGAADAQVAMIIAQSELQKINSYATPEDKLRCVQATFDFVASTLSATSRGTDSVGM